MTMGKQVSADFPAQPSLHLSPLSILEERLERDMANLRRELSESLEHSAEQRAQECVHALHMQFQKSHARTQDDLKALRSAFDGLERHIGASCQNSAIEAERIWRAERADLEQLRSAMDASSATSRSELHQAVQEMDGRLQLALDDMTKEQLPSLHADLMNEINRAIAREQDRSQAAYETRDETQGLLSARLSDAVAEFRSEVRVLREQLASQLVDVREFFAGRNVELSEDVSSRLAAAADSANVELRKDLFSALETKSRMLEASNHEMLDRLEKLGGDCRAGVAALGSNQAEELEHGQRHAREVEAQMQTFRQEMREAIDASSTAWEASLHTVSQSLAQQTALQQELSTQQAELQQASRSAQEQAGEHQASQHARHLHLEARTLEWRGELMDSIAALGKQVVDEAKRHGDLDARVSSTADEWERSQGGRDTEWEKFATSMERQVQEIWHDIKLSAAASATSASIGHEGSAALRDLRFDLRRELSDFSESQKELRGELRHVIIESAEAHKTCMNHQERSAAYLEDEALKARHSESRMAEDLMAFFNDGLGHAEQTWTGQISAATQGIELAIEAAMKEASSETKELRKAQDSAHSLGHEALSEAKKALLLGEQLRFESAGLLERTDRHIGASAERLERNNVTSLELLRRELTGCMGDAVLQASKAASAAQEDTQAGLQKCFSGQEHLVESQRRLAKQIDDAERALLVEQRQLAAQLGALAGAHEARSRTDTAERDAKHDELQRGLREVRADASTALQQCKREEHVVSELRDQLKAQLREAVRTGFERTDARAELTAQLAARRGEEELRVAEREAAAHALRHAERHAAHVAEVSAEKHAERTADACTTRLGAECLARCSAEIHSARGAVGDLRHEIGGEVVQLGRRLTAIDEQLVFLRSEIAPDAILPLLGKDITCAAERAAVEELERLRRRWGGTLEWQLECVVQCLRALYVQAGLPPQGALRSLQEFQRSPRADCSAFGGC